MKTSVISVGLKRKQRKQLENILWDHQQGGGGVDKGRGLTARGQSLLLVGSGWIWSHTIILYPLTGEYILHNTISPSFKCARYCRPGLLLIHLSIPGGHLYNCCKSEYAQFILKTRLCVDVLFYHIPFLKSLILHTTPRTEQRWVGLRIMNPPLSQILIHTKILVGYGNPTPKYHRQIFPGLLFRKSAHNRVGFAIGVRSGYLRIRWSRWSEIRPMGRFFRFQGLKCGFELTDHIDMRKLAEMTAKVRLRATN